MVEAECPNSPFRVGDIIYKPHPEDMLVNDKDLYTQIQVFGRKSISDFPHIFRPMHWSEGRTLDEMPKYLRRIRSGNEVVKVHEYRLIRGKRWVVPEWAKKVGYDSIVTDYLPATEAEYLEYLKSKNNESIKRNSRTAERCKI